MPYFNEGRYKAKIILAQRSKAKGSGNDQVELHLELLAEMGDDKDKDKEYAPPRTQFPPVIYLTLTENTMGTPQQPGWVADVLMYLGFDGDFDNLAKLEWWEGFVYCKHEEGQDGKKRDKFSIERPAVAKVIPQDKSDARRLNGKFGSIFKRNTPPPPEQQPENPAEQKEPPPQGSPSINGRKPRKETVPPIDETPNDDIPF
jgi:hypothetical protein